LRHVSAPGAVDSSAALNAAAFDGGFDVYVELSATSNHGSECGGASASSFSVSTSVEKP
jgi:hypothetical protein